MTLKTLAAKAFDEGQRIRLTAVPLTEKEKEKMKPSKKSYQELKAENPNQGYVKKETYDTLKSVNISLSQANEELQKALQEVGAKHNAELTELYMKRRDLEVRIEGMVAEVKGARAEAELVKGANKELGDIISRLQGDKKRLSESIDILVDEIQKLKESRERTKKEWFKDRTERDTFSRLLKIIKATANGMTLEGEDRVSGVGEGLNG